jgi:hypothetical protein
VIVTGEPAADVGVYETEQVVPESVQELVGENVPDPELENVTLPVGTCPPVPDATALMVVGEPTATEDRLEDAVVVVAPAGVT